MIIDLLDPDPILTGSGHNPNNGDQTILYSK